MFFLREKCRWFCFQRFLVVLCLFLGVQKSVFADAKNYAIPYSSGWASTATDLSSADKNSVDPSWVF